MQWSSIEGECQKCINFTYHAKSNADYCTGGIINNGIWGWIANGSHLQIVSLENGEKISTYDFEDSSSNDAIIICIEEIKCYEDVILAICLQNSITNAGGSLDNCTLALFSINKSCILSSISLKTRVTCTRYIAHDDFENILKYFDGCLAIADAQGVVILLNLNLKNLLHKHNDKKLCEKVTRHFCHILNYDLPLCDLQQNLQRCHYEEIYYAVELPGISEQTTICSILPIPAIDGLAVGLKDGRLAIYDILHLRMSTVFTPQPHHKNMPIVRLCFLLPLDDPRPSLYVWAVHQNDRKIIAVMHGLFYDKYLSRSDGSSSLKNFRKSNMCLELPLDGMSHSSLTSCQAISLAPTHSDEDSGTLCMFSWSAKNADKNKILLFDLNQWYKEEMPLFLNEKYSKCSMGLTLNYEDKEQCLHVYINPNTISHYNSVQRVEEHFYPNALSFSLIVLQRKNCRTYNWEGSQNQLIQVFQNSNAAIFLEVDKYFKKILQTNLLPHVINANSFDANTTVSLEKKYEVLLSVALENNCYNLLRDCVHSWSDGSFSGNLGPTTGLSLSVITEWIWRSATNLEKRCIYLCNGLLENNGYDIDRREQKELGSLTRQLKLLYDLMREIITNSKRKIPEEVNSSLGKQMKSLYSNTFFYRVVLWLFNIGLLPATNHNSTTTQPTDTAFIYNFMELELLYKKRRKYFAKLYKDSISKRTNSCRLLYIDAFIEHECRNSDLYELWCQNNGNGIYPPRSLGDMLRILLLPNIEFDSKCVILMYFFLDMHVMLEQLKPYKSIEEQFVKFPSVFQLSPSLMKTVQTFWFIDRGCFSPIIDEYISLIRKNHIQSEWLLELLMEILLVQNKADLALRVLQARPVIISPKMKLKTLIANDLITEAFHMARTDNTEPLLELFFNYCIETGRYGVVRDLTLTEREGHLLQSLLNRSKVFCAENLQFVFLLSRSKYIEAIAYMDELSKRKDLRNPQTNNYNNNIETSQLVLSAFNTTIAPMQQGLTDTYFRIHNKIKYKDVLNKNSPVPLSCQLIKQNANNLLGGIYHSSALSAHFATYNYETETQKKAQKMQNNKNNLFIPNNVPFLRKPQVENYAQDFKDKNTVSIPQLYRVPNKRHLNEDHASIELGNVIEEYNPPKRVCLLEHKVIDVDFMKNYRKPKKTENHSNHNKDTDIKLMQAKEEVKAPGILKRQINKPHKDNTISHDFNDDNSHMNENDMPSQKEDFMSHQNPYNCKSSCTLNDLVDDDARNNHISATRIIKNVVESPKPRKPLNRETSLKDFECMQQHSVVPEITVSNVEEDLEEDNNQIEEFKPQVSSSKVCESQSRFEQSAIIKTIKYTECSTVIGTISYDDEISTENQNKSSTTITKTLQNRESSRKAMLETTMDMTSWEEGFLLERDAAINLQEENHAKGNLTQENKEVYFTALSANWQNKDSGLNSTVNSKKSQITENSESCNLYDFSEEILEPNDEASIILSLEDSDLACIDGNRPLAKLHDAKDTQDSDSAQINLVDDISNDNCTKDDENTKESANNVSADKMISDQKEIEETSFYQSFYEDKCTSDKNSENGNDHEDEKEKLVEKDDNCVVISIADSDSFTSNVIQSDGENEYENEVSQGILNIEDISTEIKEIVHNENETNKNQHENEVSQGIPDIEDNSMEINETNKSQQENEMSQGILDKEDNSMEIKENVRNEIEMKTSKASDEAQSENNEETLIKMPIVLIEDIEKIISRRRRTKRGISVPPQTANVCSDSPAAYVMEKAIKHRATSLQPFSEEDEYNKYIECSESPKVSGRARRGSGLREAINLSPIVGSPYQNTRSRVRLNSEESENDVSIISRSTRSRNKSIASEIIDDVISRPLRKRKVSTNESLNSSSVSVKEEETDEKSKSKVQDVETNEILKQRRLTRQQLKVFEKSLSKNLINNDTEEVEEVPTPSRKLRGTRSIKSFEREKDDTISEKSVASSTRSKRSSKRKAAPKQLAVIIEDEQNVPTTSKSRTKNSKK